MKLIVGLGNPGKKYKNVRHNFGFMLLDEMVKDFKYEEKFKSEIAKLDSDLLLAKPQTFMNNSGIAISLITKFYKIAPEDIIIVHDDLDLHLGKIKVRLGGSGAGHHGVESIIASLGTDQFIRIRLGIRNDKLHSPEKFVLESFLSNEKSEVRHMLKIAIKALEILLEKGIETAQNQYN